MAVLHALRVTEKLPVSGFGLAERTAQRHAAEQLQTLPVVDPLELHEVGIHAMPFQNFVHQIDFACISAGESARRL